MLVLQGWEEGSLIYILPAPGRNGNLSVQLIIGEHLIGPSEARQRYIEHQCCVFMEFERFNVGPGDLIHCEQNSELHLNPADVAEWNLNAPAASPVARVALWFDIMEQE